jgi:hypothetical protein
MGARTACFSQSQHRQQGSQWASPGCASHSAGWLPSDGYGNDHLGTHRCRSGVSSTSSPLRRNPQSPGPPTSHIRLFDSNRQKDRRTTINRSNPAIFGSQKGLIKRISNKHVQPIDLGSISQTETPRAKPVTLRRRRETSESTGFGAPAFGWGWDSQFGR